MAISEKHYLQIDDEILDAARMANRSDAGVAMGCVDLNEGTAKMNATVNMAKKLNRAVSTLFAPTIPRIAEPGWEFSHVPDMYT